MFLIKHAKSPEALLVSLNERFSEIVADNEALAHTRIVASKFLIHEISHALRQLEGHSHYFSSEAKNTARIKGLALFQFKLNTPAMSYAESCEQRVMAIQTVIDVLYQFIGMHSEATEDVVNALEIGRPDELARAIVASSRQVSAFIHAVSKSTSSSDVWKFVEGAILSSIGVSPRRDISDQMHVAGQLNQFWNQNGTGNNSNQQLAAHDVRLTLEILQRELTDIRRIGRRLKRMAERGISKPSRLQRHPVLGIGLTVATVTVTRETYIHSRFLGGTGLIEDSMSQYSEVLRIFFQHNIYDPSVHFYTQIFRAAPTTVSEESIEEARASLSEMLIDFTKHNLSQVEGAVELAEQGSMKAVMELVIEQAKHPLRNSIAGSLTQAIMLQVQKLKCDVEELMLKSKQMLRAQELNLALVALLPTLLTAAVGIYITTTATYFWRSRGTEMIETGAQTAQFLLGDVHKTLLTLDHNHETDWRDRDQVMDYMKQMGTLISRVSELEDLVENQLVRAPSKIMMRFLLDLQVLRSSKLSARRRIEHTSRMFSVYPFLRNS